MPAIKEYRAPPARLEPSARGMAEWETTARRAGPLYNAAAQDVRERGKLAGDDIEAGGWQLNFLNMYHKLRVDQEDAIAEQRYRRENRQFRVQYSRGNHSSGSPMAGGAIAGAVGDPGRAISGAVGLSQIAAAGASGSKGGKLYEPETYKDELQRDLANDPWSFDDLTKRLTGESNTEYNRNQEYSDYDQSTGKPLEPLPSPSSSSSSSGFSQWWGSQNWIPSVAGGSGGWYPSGSSGDSAVVTEGREHIE